MKVFSNTTPFIALSSINQLELLPKIFGKIHIVKSVQKECLEGGRIMVADPAGFDWIHIHKDDNSITLPVLLELDKGEKQTIAVSIKEGADLVLIDEKIGRNVGEYLGLKLTGTLGVLVKAKKLGYEALSKL